MEWICNDLEGQAKPLPGVDASQSPAKQASGSGVGPRVISDAILGLSDGLTVPFALTAGLSTFGSSKLVVLGGLAELIAGAISMGLGGYVGAKSEAESYQATKRKCEALVKSSQSTTFMIVQEHFQQYQIDEKNCMAISKRIHESPEALTDFLMRNHFDAAELPDSRAYISAMTLAAAYFSGGFIPLIPYFAVATNEVLTGLFWSIGIMAVVLVIFGYVKTGIVRGWRGKDNVIAGVKGALQMLLVGAAAAGAAVGLVRAIDRGNQV